MQDLELISFLVTECVVVPTSCYPILMHVCEGVAVAA